MEPVKNAVNLAEIRYVYDGSGLLLRETSANSLQLKRRGLAPVESNFSRNIKKVT